MKYICMYYKNVTVSIFGMFWTRNDLEMTVFMGSYGQKGGKLHEIPKKERKKKVCLEKHYF